MKERENGQRKKERKNTQVKEGPKEAVNVNGGCCRKNSILALIIPSMHCTSSTTDQITECTHKIQSLNSSQTQLTQTDFERTDCKACACI